MVNLRQCMLATVIAAALPFSALAQSAAVKSTKPLNGKGGNLQWKNEVITGGESVQVVEPFILDSLPNAYSYFTNNQQPLQYDPVSNTLATIKRGNATESGNNFYVRRSQDLGATWTPSIGPLHDANSGLARYPSLLIINPGETVTNPDDLLFAYTAPLVSTATGAFGPVVSGLLLGSDAIPEVNEGVQINGETYLWSTDAKMAASVDGQVILFVSKLQAPSGSADLSAGNNFALRRNEGLGDWTVILPAQWAQDKFATPTTAGTSTSETVGMQRDAAGNFHMAAQGRFVNSADENRVFAGVSSSTDGGKTWSEFNIFPQSAIATYATANQMNPDSSYFGFSASDFAVTGVNEYSLIMNIFESGLDPLTGESSTIKAHLIEVYYKGGAWAIRKVADVSGLVLSYVPDATTTPNQMGNEVQVARTADGTKLLAKWIEFYNYVSQDGQDTTTGGDVTFAIRSLDSETWSDPVNVTQTELFDRVTWIPNIVPNDLRNIPILSLETILDGTEATFADVQLKQRDPAIPQYIVIRAVDPQFVTGINEEVVNNLRMTSVAPNPAQDMAQFAYSLTSRGQVTIDVVNIMGQTILTLENAVKDAGDYTVTFNAAELPAGTYYYTLKHNGGSITRMMTVVR